MVAEILIYFLIGWLLGILPSLIFVASLATKRLGQSMIAE